MVSGAFAVALSWMRIRIRCPIILSLRSTTKRIRSMGTHYSSLSLNKENCVRPFIADRMWGDQQLLHRELSCMSACKIFLPVELLVWLEVKVKALYSRTAARNRWTCRGSRPHSRMMHHEGVVSLTIKILLSTVTGHFRKGLSISLPCRKNWVAQTWLAYIPAGIAYILRSHM